MPSQEDNLQPGARGLALARRQPSAGSARACPRKKTTFSREREGLPSQEDNLQPGSARAAREASPSKQTQHPPGPLAPAARPGATPVCACRILRNGTSPPIKSRGTPPARRRPGREHRPIQDPARAIAIRPPEAVFVPRPGRRCTMAGGSHVVPRLIRAMLCRSSDTLKTAEPAPLWRTVRLLGAAFLNWARSPGSGPADDARCAPPSTRAPGSCGRASCPACAASTTTERNRNAPETKRRGGRGGQRLPRHRRSRPAVSLPVSVRDTRLEATPPARCHRV